MWVDEQLSRPRDIYDETKLQAEEMVASAGNAIGRDVTQDVALLSGTA